VSSQIGIGSFICYCNSGTTGIFSVALGQTQRNFMSGI
jgi:hypothetical protein